MKTKTIKTPLMTAEAYGWMVLNKNRKNTTKVSQALRALVLPSDFPCESKLSQIKSALHPHSTNLGPLPWKNPASLKNRLSLEAYWLSWLIENGFLGFSESAKQDAPQHSPSKLDSAFGFHCFSSDDVFGCAATSGDGRACAGACSQAKSHVVITIARSAKTSAEGFFRFLLTSEIGCPI